MKLKFAIFYIIDLWFYLALRSFCWRWLWVGRTALVVTLIYLASGNIALLSEVIVGTVLVKRVKVCRCLPLLLVAFFLNVFICTVAFVDALILTMFGKPRVKWDKTVHNGVWRFDDFGGFALAYLFVFLSFCLCWLHCLLGAFT